MRWALIVGCGKGSGVPSSMGTLKAFCQRVRSRLIHVSLSDESVSRARESPEEEERMLTLNLKGWAVVAGFHDAAQEDGYIGYFALFEEW